MPNPIPKPTGRQAGGLAAIVGIGVATALFVSTPKEESGRTVKVELDASGKPKITHVSGKQYLKVYLDIVGVATACDGLTGPEINKARRDGKVFTEAECTVMLEQALIKHAAIVMRCSPGLARSGDPWVEKRREGPRFASVSGNYNHGGYCTSTARQRFDAGQYNAGCAALTWYNKAGGRVVQGLVNRRTREFKVCTHGLGALS